ncbi:hypothetical protein RM590_34315, partial [Streptomyces sp. DSM 44938]|nr:hypothetical protein [Streptomyces sp. DSM 44938]
MTRQRQVAVVLLAATLMALMPAARADERRNGDEENAQGDFDGEEISAEVEADPTVTFSEDTSGGNGRLTSSDTSWFPPACYYAPTYAPEQYRAYWDELSSEFYGAGHLPEDKEALRQDLEETYGENGQYP